MMIGTVPRWLNWLERRLGWIAVPNIGILFVTLQALGFFLVEMDPIWINRLALFPQQVLAGEYWRLITFLALPIASSPIWVIFVLWFIYFIFDSIEKEWGSFKTTLYVLVSILLSIAMALIFDFPIAQASDFESTLFLAAAALFPEMQVSLFFVIPVKMRWLGWLTLGFLGFRFVSSDWLSRIYLIAIYSNYLLFFGPSILQRLRQFIRRESFKRKMRMIGFFTLPWTFLAAPAAMMPTSAEAALYTGLWWLGSYEKPRPSSNTGGFSGLGVGGTLEFVMFHAIGLETGVFLQSVMLNAQQNSYIMAPLMLRLWLLPSFSVAGGAYYSYQVTNTSSDYATNNYGLRALVGLNFDYGPKLASALAFEVGYQYGLLNLAKNAGVAGTDLYENEIIFLIGFRFKSSSSGSSRSHGILPFVPYRVANPN